MRWKLLTLGSLVKLPPALVAAAFIVRAIGAISVSELNYNDPEDPDFEFIELINTGPGSATLTGARFSAAISYTFIQPTVLAAGERIVVVRNRSKFTARYGTVGIRLADGAFTGRFADEGELVTLVDSANAGLLAFTYGPDGQWPSRPAGLGSTLECIDPAGNLDDPDNWRASAEWLGSPGRAGAGPQRVIVINEVLAHTDPPLEDAIELVNLTDQVVDMSGWYLSNERAQPKKYRIPDGTVLAKGGRTVFYEYQFDPTDEGFRFNSAHGDEVVLMSADIEGNLKFWMDAVSIEATANGVSVGRFPDATGRLTTLGQLTLGTEVTAGYPPEFISIFRTGLGASNSYPLVGPVVFSRIQYHPAPGGDEFLELQNNSEQDVPLYDFDHPENTWRLRDAVDFDFPEGVVLASGARLLVTGIEPAVFRAKYGIPANIPVLGPWTNALNNAGERVALYKPDPPQLPPHPDAGFVPYVLVEGIDYLPAAPWPPASDGNGPALRRKRTTQFGNDPLAWEAETILPPEPPVLGIAPLPAGVRLSFVAESGRTYRLEGLSGLAGTWKDLGIVNAPAEGGAVMLDVGPIPGFYRVQVE